MDSLVQQLLEQAKLKTTPHILLVAPLSGTMTLIDVEEWSGQISSQSKDTVPSHFVSKIQGDARARGTTGSLVVHYDGSQVQVHFAPFPATETESSGVTVSTIDSTSSVLDEGPCDVCPSPKTDDFSTCSGTSSLCSSPLCDS